MKFDSIIFLLDRRMAAFRPGKKPELISLAKLPQVPMIPSYYHLEESGESQEAVIQELRPYVKGFFRKQAVLLCMPDDAPVFVDQKYMREFFICHGAGTNTTVRTLESLCLEKGREYVAVSRSERLITLTYRRGQSQPKTQYLPLSLANPETVGLGIKSLSPEAAYNEPDIYILDPDEKLQEYYELGTPVGLEELAKWAQSLAEKNWV